MGSGTPISQGATIPQSAPAAPQSARAPITIRGPNGFTTFTPAAEPLKGKTFATTDRRNIPTILDRVAAGQKVDGFEIVSSSPPPPSPTRQAEREASRPINPATGRPFDGFAGIPNLTTGDLGGDAIQTGDSGIPDDFDFQSFIDSQNFTPAPSVSSGSAFADDDFADFKNFGGFFPGEARDSGLSSDFGLLAFTTGVLPGFEPSAGSIPLPFNPETVLSGSREEAFLQTLDPNFKVGGAQPASPAPAPQEDDIIFDAFDPPSQPLPLIDFNEAVAQQQIQAGNIAAALQDQTGRSNPILDAILRGRERAQAERQRRTKQTGSPTGGLPQVADASKFSKFLSDAGQAVKKGLTAIVTPGSSNFLRLEDAKGGVPAGDVLRGVQLGTGRKSQLVPKLPPRPSKPFVTNQQIIRNLGSPVTGKGGEPPRRSVFDVLFNSDPPPPKVVPSTTVQIPLGIRDRLLDDAQGRARGGLVGLMRKGN